MRIIPVATIAIVLTATSVAQTKRAMTIDDSIAAVRVSDLQLSPDGKRAVFVRTTTLLDTGRRNADIWTVPADGSVAPKELIAASLRRQNQNANARHHQ